MQLVAGCDGQAAGCVVVVFVVVVVLVGVVVLVVVMPVVGGVVVLAAVVVVVLVVVVTHTPGSCGGQAHGAPGFDVPSAQVSSTAPMSQRAPSGRTMAR